MIAKNGSGKTTLLNIIAGKEGYDEGSIVFRRDLCVGYLEQDPHYPEELTVLEACFHHGNTTVQLIKEYERCMETEGNPGMEDLLARMEHEKAWDYERKAKQILSQLKIRDFNQQVKHLSGGQLKRVALANVLITKPDFLILDEPTNHLDLDMTEWLEDYLRRGNISLLMVTHDRYFLDRVCSEIIEIDNKQVYSYKGNYSYYLEKRQERIEATNAEIARANNLYRTELEWMRRMPQARGHKARYREEAFYELEKVAKQRTYDANVKLDVKASYIGSKIFESDHLCKHFGDLKILDDFSYIFARYEKMGIVGNNGTGKSTFIKILMGLEKPDSGTLDIGETVRFGYYSQEGLQFNEQMKVIDVITDIAEVIELGNGKRLTASQFLQHFLFTPETQHSYVYKLSGGERRRLYLCTVLMRNPNFLVLDEPTNDLDIVTLQVLEEYLQNFKGCVIVVSHDRHFLNTVCTNIVDVDYGGIKMYVGNYEFWYESSQMMQRLIRDQNKKKEEKIKELQEFVSRFSANKSKSKQATARRKLLDKLTVEEMPASSRRYPFVGFKMDREPGKEILAVEGLTKTVDGRKVLDNVSFRVNKGDKIAFVGEDEIATTTLFKILMEELEPDEGTFKWGTTITTSYFPLDNSAFFNDCDLNLVDWLGQYTADNAEEGTESFKRSFLGRMLFSGDDVYKPVKVLSGGEKVRCMLSRMMLFGSNVLVLDQPTNHLDLESITAVNNGLIDFKGVVLFASHDHEFVETIADRIMEFVDGKLIDKMCTYDDYISGQRDEMLARLKG